MARFLTPLFLAFTLFAPVRAAETPTGTWRLAFPVETRNGPVTLNILLVISEADGKLVADFLDSAPPLGAEPTIDLTVKDDLLKFGLKFGPNNWSYEGKIQAGNKRIKGTIMLGDDMILADIVPSALKSLTKDRFAVAKEMLDAADDPKEFFNAVFPVLGQAGEKKMKVEDVRAYADKANKLAESYGPRWQRNVAFRLAETLAGQEAYVAIAVELARQGERMLTRTDDIPTQLKTLDTLASVLRKAKKDVDAKEVEGRIAKLEPRDYAEYAKSNPPFKIEEFKGRDGKSDRVVLVELFTGSECPPCVAVDLAFDALGMSFKSTDVVLLQYHQHIPGPDPLTSKDGATRMDFYAKKDDDKATPMLMIAGKADTSGGGNAKQSGSKYRGYRETIEELLKKPAGAKLSATAALKGNELSIKAIVADLDKPGEKMSLRFALTEERVRYQGGNGLRYHHAVVRAMPGGPKGFALTKKTHEETVVVKLDEVKAALNKHLDEVEKASGDAFTSRPMNLRNLRVVAFIQNDETNEVLTAVQVEVDGGKE